MEWLEFFKAGLTELVEVAKFCLEAISVYCVLFGVVKTIQLVFQSLRWQNNDLYFIQIRIQLGLWLSLALEFQLGADILATTVAPSTEALIQLGVIAVIRTFLNYFLNEELEKEYKFRDNAEKARIDQ
ncbi:MAG: DUF1622 domain-containing protein [Microcoleaceae cyanobacterium]